jgi:hypothetical protein
LTTALRVRYARAHAETFHCDLGDLLRQRVRRYRAVPGLEASARGLLLYGVDIKTPGEDAMKLAIGLVAVLIVSSASLAHAESWRAKPAQTAWKNSDKCNQRAFQLFPDYTADQIKKRDAYVRKCQAELGAPTQQPLASPGNGRQ